MPIHIFKPHNVIFTQIAYRLNFDDFDRDRARISEAVNFPKRYIGGLVFTQKQHLIAIGHLGCAFDNDPVLGAVVVFLQAETSFWLDLNALDLEATTFIDTVVLAPAAMHFAM